MIWRRWTWPMLQAQYRYWSDHPRVDQMIANYLGYKQRKTPPSGKIEPPRPFDWHLLDEPETPKSPSRKLRIRDDGSIGPPPHAR